MNMMMKLAQKCTSLENVDKEFMLEVMTNKLEHTSPQGLTDYIGLALDNLDDKLERIKIAKAELKMIEDEAKMQKEHIKMEVANLLQANGIDKLQGDRVSSITVYNPKPNKSVNIKDEATLMALGYVKTTLDTTKIKADLESGLIDEDLAELKESIKPTTIKLNKKRGA